MREILHSEILKERCNAKALGAYSASVGSVSVNDIQVNPNNINTFQEYKDMKSKQDEIVSSLSDKLNSFQKGSMGLLSDSVLSSPEYRKARGEYNKEFKLLQDLNSKGSKKFKKELSKERAQRIKEINDRYNARNAN